MARRWASIPHSHNLWHLPHSLTPQSLTHDHEHRRRIPPVGWYFSGLWRRNNLAQRRQLCKKLTQPETAGISVWFNSYLANQQVVTVAPMSVSLMSLSLMSLSQMSLSAISLPSTCARTSTLVRSKPVFALQRRRAFLLRSGSNHVRFLCCNLFISGTDQGMGGGVLFA